MNRKRRKLVADFGGTHLRIGFSYEKKIENFSFEILAFTGSMLSLKKDCKINIYASGKIAIITKDLNQVKELASDLENVLNIKKK